MTNPETPKNPEAPKTTQELRTLESQVTGDRRKFESLLKNSTLKNGLDKILKKESASIISTFENQYKERENTGLSIESRTRLIAKSHPGLLWFVCGDLGLPYEELAVRGMKNTKFSQLTYEQKMNFISLYNTLRTYNFDISKVKPEDFINKYKSLAAGNIRIITENFNKRVNDNENIVGLVDLKKVLKNQYGLTDTETKKVEEYVELIQKHPEYVGGFSGFSEMQQASFPWKSFFECVKWAIIVGGAVFGISQFKGCYSLETPETRVYGDHTEITNFKKVFKAMSAQAETFSSRRQFEEEGYGHIDESGGFVIGGGKKIINKAIDAANLVQSRKLDLELKTEIGYLFDFDTVQCTVELKDGKGYFYVKVKKPEVKITNTEAKIYKSSRERINMDKFDDFELRAVETLKKEAIDEASKPEKIEKAKEYLRENLLSHFQVTGFANSQMVILAKDVQDVIIEYDETDDLPSNFDPENGGRIVIKN